MGNFLYPSLAFAAPQNLQGEVDCEANPEDIACDRALADVITVTWSMIDWQMMKTEGISAYNRRQLWDRLQNYGCHCFNSGEENTSVSGSDNQNGEYFTNKDERWTQNADFERTCDSTKNDAAQQALCECDLQFAKDFSQAYSDDLWNAEFWGNQRNVNDRIMNGEAVMDQDMCTCMGDNCTKMADACCGDYPYKVPFFTGTNDCCAGEVKAMGSC